MNSYKRLQPGSWAPANTYFDWRTAQVVAARSPNGVIWSSALPTIAPSPTCSWPVSWARVSMGFGGGSLPPPPFQGDIGHLTAEEIARYGIGYLPDGTLPQALEALERDEVVASAVGETALRHFLTVKRHELAIYETHVHPWERETYLEMI